MSRSLFRFHSLRVKKVKLLCGFWPYNPHYTWWETTPEWKLFVLCLIYKIEIFTYTLSYAYRYMMSTTFLLNNILQTTICLKTDIENQIHSQLLVVLVAQTCPTLCDPMDCSPPGSSIHGIFQDKNTGVGCHILLQGILLTQGLNLGPTTLQVDSTIWATKEWKSLSRVWLFETPWNIQSLEFSRPEN